MGIKPPTPQNVMLVSKRCQEEVPDEGSEWPAFQAKCEALRTFRCNESQQGADLKRQVHTAWSQRRGRKDV